MDSFLFLMNTITSLTGNHHYLTKKPIIVHVEGEIDDESLEPFREQFNKAVARNQPYIPIVIHTMGGDVYTALAMMAHMQIATVPVVTIVPSHAYSAGVLLFSAGTEGYRYVGPNATIMLHDASIEDLSGNCRTIAHEASELKRVNTMMYRLTASNVGQPPTFFENKVGGCAGDDLYVDARTAKKWKLANHIALPQLETKIEVSLQLVEASPTVPPQTRFIEAETDDEESDDEDPPKKKKRKKRDVDDDDDDDSKKRTRRESVTELLARILEKDED